MARLKYPFRVNGVDIPCPSKFDISYQDISAPDSGRTLDGLMWKNKVGQKVKMVAVSASFFPSHSSSILTAFDPEYIDLTYHDAKTNTIITKNFYTGDRKGSTYWWDDNGDFTYSSIAFNIVER